jgi:hypothetical protein
MLLNRNELPPYTAQVIKDSGFNDNSIFYPRDWIWRIKALSICKFIDIDRVQKEMLPYVIADSRSMYEARDII